MKNWKLYPENKDIAKVVDCYWGLEKEEGDTGYDYPKLNPDPASHLIFSNSPQHYSIDGQHSELTAHHMIYPYLKTMTLDHRHSFKILGVKFKVGGLYSLPIGFSKDQLNRVVGVDVEALTGVSNQEIMTLIESDFDSPELIVKNLDELLHPWILKSTFDKHSDLVSKILSLIETSPINELAEKLHCSQRTLERSFQKVTHLTMKQYQSMMRLEAILQYLYKKQAEEINWTDLASKFEFSDQPHLIRTLKKVIGKTPSEYSKQRDLTIDVYGDFDFE